MIMARRLKRQRGGRINYFYDNGQPIIDATNEEEARYYRDEDRRVGKLLQHDYQNVYDTAAYIPRQIVGGIQAVDNTVRQIDNTVRETKRQLAEEGAKYFTKENIEKYRKYGEPVTEALAESLFGDRWGKFAGAAHKAYKAATDVEPEARNVLNAIEPLIRQVNRGVRSFSAGAPQKAIQATKNRKVGKRSRKPGARRPTSQRNKRAKHSKKMTKKRAKENTTYALSHPRPTRSAQFYRDNGLPVPAGVS